MFDKGSLKLIFDQYKQEIKEDILSMIDIALDTNDKEWFKELTYQLSWVK